MSDSLKTLLVIAFLIVIVWNLGAGLYYLLVDRGQTKRTVNALTRRIAVSVALILLVIVSIYMGWINRTASAAEATDACAVKHVDEHEEHQPHHVDEVPVPRGRFKTEWLSRVKCPLAERSHITISMIVPSSTCAPWKPVSMKNVEP